MSSSSSSLPPPPPPPPSSSVRVSVRVRSSGSYAEAHRPSLTVFEGQRSIQGELFFEEEDERTKFSAAAAGFSATAAFSVAVVAFSAAPRVPTTKINPPSSRPAAAPRLLNLLPLHYHSMLNTLLTPSQPQPPPHPQSAAKTPTPPPAPKSVNSPTTPSSPPPPPNPQPTKPSAPAWSHTSSTATMPPS